MTYRAVAGLVLVAGCAWSNSLYQARLLSRDAATAEREKRPAEAQQYWGQVIAKAESAFARSPQGARGAEALWLSGHAAARIGDCPRAIPRLQSAMSAGPGAPWRQELLFELARCEEPVGGPTAVSLYTTLIASTTDPIVLRQARLRLGHALVLRDQWDAALVALAGNDTLPARLDRATALIQLGRTTEALTELTPALGRADTSVRWLPYVDALAARNSSDADALIDRLLTFPAASIELRSSWLLAGARAALRYDPVAADRRLKRLAGRPAGAAVAEGRMLQQQLRLIRATSIAGLRAAVDSVVRAGMPEDGPGVRTVGEALRIARRLIAMNDAIAPGSATGDLMIFGLGEIARDSLGAPAVGAWCLARLEREWPQSPYVAKALMARAPLEPDSTADLLARLRGLADNPYVAAANGDVAARVRVTQLEDSLGRFIDHMWLTRLENQ